MLSQSWENLQAAQARLRNTQWLSRNTLTVYIFEQNSTQFQNKSLYNITIFILFLHIYVKEIFEWYANLFKFGFENLCITEFFCGMHFQQ